MEEKNTKSSRNLLGVGMALLLVVAAFFSGVHFGSIQSSSIDLEAGILSLFGGTTARPDNEADLDEFWRVWNLMDEKFVEASSTERISEQDRVRGAIQGLVQSYGDPYTVFFPPSDADQFDEEISGNFGGLGMEVGIRNGVVTVIAPLPDTPAEKAGLLAADVIVKIDDVSTENMNINDAVRKMRGKEGTEVVLTVYRVGEADFLEIPVIRGIISIPTVKTEQQGDVFIIALYSFNALAEQKMQEALREYVKSGANKLVLDLRDNPGGFLQGAVAVASHFMPVGEVVVRENFGDGSPEELYRSNGKTLGDLQPKNMVVLVNGGSASASEIVAGALSQHNVATLIGETTFGKGSVQELVDLPGGSSLKVTIARWFTPDGTSISKAGLEPDIEVTRTVEQIMADEDPQLDAAIAWLNGDKSVGTSTEDAVVESGTE